MKNLFLSVAITAVFLTTAAKAETINCTQIVSVPTIIAAQGIYCLKSDQSSNLTTGNMIDIQANNVTIDLNGFKLGGLGAGPATHAVGIFAGGRKNITIRNGSIRGFSVGVGLVGALASGHLIENLLLDGNRSIAIQVQGSGHVIRGNRVVNTGPGSSTTSIGMLVGSGNTVVADNIISGTSNTDFAEGIVVSGAILVDVRNNTVLDAKDATNKIGIRIGATSTTVIGNHVFNAAGTGTKGIDATGSAAVNCIGNTIAGFTTAFTACTFDSGNIVPP